MKNKIKKFFSNNPDILPYIIVGILTTIVSWGAAFVSNILFFNNQLHPTVWVNFILVIINWSTGVIFSFFATRKFVFISTSNIFTEASKFILSRLSTFFIHLFLTEVARNIGINYYLYTVFTAIFIVIINYLLSKKFVFKKTQRHKVEYDIK